MTTDVENGGPIPPKQPVEDVAFLNAKRDEVELREKSPRCAAKFIGLTKEELSTFADDPFWVRTRRVLFIAFWVVWLAMIVAAATIIAVSPQCPARPPQKWWDAGVVYRINVKSYKDSNEDGKGDLAGLRSALSYVKALQASAISLSSFLQTSCFPSNDSAAAASTLEGPALSGADVTDFKASDSAAGNLEDVKALIKDARKIGLKVLLEIDPNLSSDQHPFFKDSVAKLESRKDFYVWNNSSGPSVPPTLWSGQGKEKVWHLDPDRMEWFYSRAGAKYPEFNYASEGVKEEMRHVFSYWLGEGIDGFVVQSAAFLYEDPKLEDGFVNEKASIKFIAEIRKLIEDFSSTSGKDVALVVDARDTSGDQKVQDRFYHDGVNPGAHIVLNNAFIDGLSCGGGKVDGKCLTDLVKTAKKISDESADKLGVEVQRLWPNWLSSSAAKGRLGSRLSRPGMKDALNLMTLTMQGTAFIWFGDEIGMAGDPFTPMQWDDSSNAGFTSSAVDPWLPIGADAAQINVKFEKAIGNDQSILTTFVEVAALRSEPAFAYGQMTPIDGGNDLLFSFVREALGHPSFYVAINFGDAKTTIPVGLAEDSPKKATVVATTANAHPSIAVDKVIDLGKEDILLKPGHGVVLRLG